MFYSHTSWLVLCFALVGQHCMAQCNGSADLCGKRFDQVAYVTTHNAFNAEEDGFNLPNHTYGITRQLNDGVRGLMIDVYDEGGVATVYHSFALLGTATLESNLQEIKDFLDANPNEIVTIIFECYADFELVETAFVNTELLSFAHQQNTGDPWPTLQQMIDSGKRLVVLSDRNDAAPGENWYHYVWEYAVETPFSNNSNSDFTCDFNRGNPDNGLFILNHFATDPDIGIGRTDLSELANEFDFFYNRADACWNTLGKFPNFLTIDFHELGDVFEVADSINARLTVGVDELNRPSVTSVFPNPSTGIFRFSFESELDATIAVFSPDGKKVFEARVTQPSLQLDLTDSGSGLYHAVIRTEGSVETLKLIHLR